MLSATFVTVWPAGADASSATTFRERIVVDAADDGTSTVHRLAASASYTVTATGTYRVGARQADAECATYPPDPTWRRDSTGVITRAGAPDPYDLYLDGAPIDWTPAKPDLLGCDTTTHTWRTTFIPSRTGVLTLRIEVPGGGAVGSLVVEVSGPAVEPDQPPTTTTTTPPATEPGPPSATAPRAVSARPAPSPPVTTDSSRHLAPPAPRSAAGPQPTTRSGVSRIDQLPPELLAPPPVMRYPAPSELAEPAVGYALRPAANPDAGLRQALPLAAALVLMGAAASTVQTALRRRAATVAAGGTSALRLPSPGSRTAHRLERPLAQEAQKRSAALHPESLSSRIGADGTCVCPSCARRYARRRRSR